MTVEAAPSRSAAAVLSALPANVWTKALLVETDVEAAAKRHAAILGHTRDPQSPLADGL